MTSMDGRFSQDYDEARARFLDAARGAGAELSSERLDRHGPDDRSLYTDVAWYGPRDAARVLVTISATHGVEGFFGSAVQVELLRRTEAEPLPTGVASGSPGIVTASRADRCRATAG